MQQLAWHMCNCNPTIGQTTQAEKRLLEPINLEPVVEFLAIILMNIPFYLRCVRYGKLKQLPLEDLDPFLHLLPLLLHHNQECLPILFLIKDMWPPNPHRVLQSLNLHNLVKIITRSS